MGRWRRERENGGRRAKGKRQEARAGATGVSNGERFQPASGSQRPRATPPRHLRHRIGYLAAFWANGRSSLAALVHLQHPTRKETSSPLSVARRSVLHQTMLRPHLTRSDCPVIDNSLDIGELLMVVCEVELGTVAPAVEIERTTPSKSCNGDNIQQTASASDGRPVWLLPVPSGPSALAIQGTSLTPRQPSMTDVVPSPTADNNSPADAS